jgi:hypothetical protein
MIGYRECCIWTANFPSGGPQSFKSLWAGYFMNQVTVDI